MRLHMHTCAPLDADHIAACCRPRRPGMNRGETTELDPVGPPVLAPIPTSERVYNPSIVAPASPAIVAATVCCFVLLTLGLFRAVHGPLGRVRAARLYVYFRGQIVRVGAESGRAKAMSCCH